MVNKKGQAASIIIAIVILFVLGIVIFFMNHLNKTLYDKFDTTFEADSSLNNSEAHLAVQKFQAIEGSNMWDYAFLAIFIGIMIQMLLFSFASRTNVAFFWIFVIFGMIVLMVGAALSNIWQDMASKAEFADTIIRFPITNTILGSYFTTIIAGITFLSMIVLFGKFPGDQNE